MFADNILKIFNIENCECTLQVDFTSHPDILNRGNLELLFVDNMTCIPFFLQRQRYLQQKITSVKLNYVKPQLDIVDTTMLLMLCYCQELCSFLISDL